MNARVFPAALLACAVNLSAASAHRFVGFTNFTTFTSARENGATTLTSPWVAPSFTWRELILSWNAACAPGSWMKLEARGASATTTTPWFIMGLWSPDPARHPRESVLRQKNDAGSVDTDTLLCTQPMERVQVRVTLGADAGVPLPRLKHLGLCLTDPAVPLTEGPSNRAAWGRVIEVPRRSQLGHPNGSGWCSPTSISMLLAHWGEQLRRPDLNHPVPEVAAAVHDRHWEGTGNWVFNTAYAGSFEGLRACVTRFDDLAEIEAWIAAGLPVAASVSFDLLNGRPKDEGSGHLIVVVGFTASGDIVANDPWPNPKGENSLRRLFPRQHFLNGWKRSRHAVYLVHPLGRALPEDARRHWSDGGK